MAELPEIRLRLSWLMTAKISEPLMKYHRGSDAKLPNHETLKGFTRDYQDAWSKHEKPILKALIDKLNLHFYLPVIDVTLAPMVPAFSTPLTLNFRTSPDEFIDTLAHELIHVLISDNRENVSFVEFASTEWSKEEPLTRTHVMVHAMLEYLYREILTEDSRLERDVANCKKNGAYARAWEIVVDEGYKSIIYRMRKHRGGQ